MKIVLFIPSLKGGGAERTFVNLVNFFAKKQYKVILLVGESGVYFNDISSQVKVTFLKKVNTSLGSSFNLLFNFPLLVLQTSIFLFRHRPNFLVCTLTTANIIGFLAHRISCSKSKLILRQANVLSEEGLSRIMRKLLLEAYSKASLIIANSPDTALSIKHALKNNLVSVAVIGNPIFSQSIIDLSKYPVIEPSNKSYILSVGSLREEKDHKTLIEAFRIVKNKFDVNLIILGVGYLEQQLKEQVKALQLQDSVFFLGFVANPYPYFSNAEIFVLSSVTEGFGNVLIESLAFGTPVISTDCNGGPRFILNDGEFGDLVPVKDPLTLSSRICDVLSNGSRVEAEKMKTRAFDFSVEVIGNVYLETFIKLYDK